jgi:UDP-galactopyranose mutase
MQYDYLIVGAGIAGLTFAERVCSAGRTCLVVDRREHIGGNCYDMIDGAGVLIHKYGPHYFRTNSARIKDYLSLFTEWLPVEYKILSKIDEDYWNFPINLNTFEQFIGRPSTSEEMGEWLDKNRIEIANPANSEEVVVSQVGWELYEKFFKGYTMKQWKRHPKDLDASVCGRIPIRMNRDDRYLQESFQAMPKEGYTAMFKKMISACGSRLTVVLNEDYRDTIKNVSFNHMVYTGPIDSFYDHRFGALPYRSLRFEHESFSEKELGGSFYQPAVQVNYPSESIPFTRTVEIKHITGQKCENTTIVREYPDDFSLGKEAYYPVPSVESSVIYKKYKELADSEKRVSFIGRLATYRYYNMDQVVGMALAEANRLDPAATKS